jgi:hypothetical protein
MTLMLPWPLVVLSSLHQNQWFKSSGHCTNIFSSSFSHIGVANTGRYWVQVSRPISRRRGHWGHGDGSR